MDCPNLNLLEEALIRIRDANGQEQRLSLPELFVALGRDFVRDYPALRPHQRHPWHALLVQLAALALHAAGETKPWDDAGDWRKALLGLTPDHPDGCAFCLVAPHDKPAFLQAPVPGGSIDGWKGIATPDALDMLVTSKNHDLKGQRMRQAQADDWLFALTSLQTQEGFPGAGNYGVSRMNGGSSSRPGVGLRPSGGIGKRWKRDVGALLDARDMIADVYGLPREGGITIVWLCEWTGTKTERIPFNKLDPFYVEICRRVRLVNGNGIHAWRSTTEGTRINADDCKGRTGDAWIPIDEDKSLTLTRDGFHYGLMAELAWGNKYRPTITQAIRIEDGEDGISLLAQCVARGQSKTEGYHERSISFPRKVAGLLRGGQVSQLATTSKGRVNTISAMRNQVLWPALTHLFDTGKSRAANDKLPENVKKLASDFCTAFERIEDARFFDDLNREIEADDVSAANSERLEWLIGLASRAEAVLISAFAIGPQCSERRYRARSKALTYFHGALRSDKHFPALAQHLRTQPAAEEAAP